MTGLHQGDAREVLKSIPSCSVDSSVTDPPAGIAFMGKDWDKDKGGRMNWTRWLTSVFEEVHRVLKPGGYCLVWALPRTSHWTAWAVEDAGFEIRDVVTHHFGTGFPKSLNVGKAIDKTTPATDAAKQWEGFGTALKPASEHWILARKPLVGTVAANVLEHGTGALNIDGCRVDTKPRKTGTKPTSDEPTGSGSSLVGSSKSRQAEYDLQDKGRWPANLVLSHSPECVEVGTREVKTGVAVQRNRDGEVHNQVYGAYRKPAEEDKTYGEGGKEEVPAWECAPDCPVAELGDAARFFYTAKASKKERGEGNDHPTVKPLALTRWLARLITPPGGVVLDPFMGSGTTGVAAREEGFGFIGVELDEHYYDIAQRRIWEGEMNDG